MLINQTKINEETQARVTATIARLIGNIPRACEVLREEGYQNLAGQLMRDRANLDYWRANGRLRFEEGA